MKIQISLWAGRAVLAGVILYILVSSVWGFAAAIAPMEAAIRDGAGSHMFRMFVASRTISFLFSLATVLLTYRLGAVVVSDAVVGAFLALAYALFPPMIGTYIMATPHAVVAFLLTASMVLISTSPKMLAERNPFCSALVGILLGTAAGLHLMGLLAAIAVLIHADIAWRSRWRGARVVMLGAWLVVFAALASWHGSQVTEDSFAPENLPPIVGAVLLPYAMIWVGAAMSFAASFSATVIARLGPLIWPARLGGLAFATILMAASVSSILRGGQFLTGVAYVFPIAVFGMLPLVVWVRFAMPKVRSMAAWIAFPVIMYCCFWFVLGPQRYVKFPFDRFDPKGQWFDSAGMPAEAAVPATPPAAALNPP